MPKSKVALIKCQNYDREAVYAAFLKGIGLLDINMEDLTGDARVLLKPNLLSAQPPESATTTHPAVFHAVGRFFKEQGNALFYGDSAPKGTTEKILKTTGIQEAADDLNIKYQSFEQKVTKSNPGGNIHKQFTIAKAVDESDILINIAKFKTHHLTRITAAVKNLFGVIPGLMKPEFHVKLPGVVEFSKMLVELDKFLDADLHVIDAIEAMEGNGPNSGRSKKLNCLIISRDPVAADSVACQLVNLKPDRVLTNQIGEENQLGTMSNIEIIGDDLAALKNQTFDIQRGINVSRNVAWKYRFLKNFVALKPLINKNKCIQCGECVKHCPVHPNGIKWSGKSSYPTYDYQACIRCYCCQEVCPKGAIDIKKPVLRTLMDKVFS